MNADLSEADLAETILDSASGGTTLDERVLSERFVSCRLGDTSMLWVDLAPSHDA